MQDLEFKLKPSKCYLTLLIIVLISSLMIMLYLPLAIGLKCIGLLLVSYYGAWLYWRFGLLCSSQAIISLQRYQGDKWLLKTPNAIHIAELRGDSTLTRWVAVLRFQLPNQFWVKSCVIFSDSLEADHYRRLIITCRY